MLSSQISVHNSILDPDLYIYYQITVVEFVCEELRWIGMFYFILFFLKMAFLFGFLLALNLLWIFSFYFFLFIYQQPQIQNIFRWCCTGHIEYDKTFS